MKAVAVSPDLIPLGLGHETIIYIEGLEGPYKVHKLQLVLESQWIVQIGEDQVSIYQDDISFLEVSIIEDSDPALMKRIITIFNNSILFKNTKTEQKH